jgi:hypothetical protein
LAAWLNLNTVFLYGLELKSEPITNSYTTVGIQRY